MGGDYFDGRGKAGQMCVGETSMVGRRGRLCKPKNCPPPSKVRGEWISTPTSQNYFLSMIANIDILARFGSLILFRNII